MITMAMSMSSMIVACAVNVVSLFVVCCRVSHFQFNRAVCASDRRCHGKGNRLGNQVQEREQVDPDEVDQVPIEPNIIDRSKILLVELVPRRLDNQPTDYDHPADNVDRMDPGHAVVDTEEQTCHGTFVDIRLGSRKLLGLDVYVGRSASQDRWCRGYWHVAVIMFMGVGRGGMVVRVMIDVTLYGHVMLMMPSMTFR